MQFTTSVAAVLAAAGAVYAQTPNGTLPATNNRLGVTYNSTVVTPGLELPIALVQTAPRLTGAANATGTYMLAMLDLSLPRTSVTNLTNVTLAAGLGGVNRTTRLHWLQTNLTPGANGSLTVPSNISAVAPYAGPMPPLNDTAHAYVFYLFNQPANFSLPSALAALNFTATPSLRNNISLAPITSAAGVVLQSANWIYVQNAANVGAVTNSSGSNATLARNGSATTTTAGAATTTSAGAAATTSARSAAGHLQVALPAVLIGAVAVFFL